jgi:crotonobetainyl-CoA:carnitine CoA-transferase CaiB-like acyl-CoA transferase
VNHDRERRAGPHTLVAVARAVLEGKIVLELGQIYNVPYCALLLAHLGATVIKVEPPTGEPARHRAGGHDATPFVMLNSGKRSVCLNLKTEAGRNLLLDLARRADVVVENYRAGVLDRLGLTYEVFHQVNPRLVVASGRGFSRKGPHASLAAMDLTVQAMTGVMAATGFSDQPPVKAGPAIADFLGGVHLLSAILAALLQREQTGVGQHVEVAMQDAMLPALASNLSALLDAQGTLPERTGNRHGGLALCPYNTYPANDGWVAIFCATDRQWLSLCDVLQRPDLKGDPALQTNPGRASRMAEIDAIVSEWTADRGRLDCLAILGEAGIPAAPVNSLKDLLEDEQISASGMLRPIEHPRRGSMRVFGSPLQLEDSPHPGLSPAPGLGEHTRAVLHEQLGLDEAQLDDLASSGAFGA